MIDETAAEIAAMQTHSSSEVAIKAATALRELLNREYATANELVRDLEHNTGALRRASPSHATLETTLRKIERAVREADHDSVDATKDTLDTAISDAIAQVQEAKTAAAENTAALLEDGETILTHDFSTTVLGALERAVAAGRTFDVYVTEARPRVLGRKTVRNLAELDGISPTLIVDSAAGHYLGECDRVLTGMTCIVDGTLYNRVGTYPIAAAANQEDVPVQVAGSSTKVIESGFVFENDYRDASEVIREPPDGFAVGNPSYDATPTELIDTLITERGTETPP